MEFNLLKFVPPEIVNLSNLVVLILHHNNLTHLPWVHYTFFLFEIYFTNKCAGVETNGTITKFIA